MLRTFLNLLIILLIAFIGSVMPLDTKITNLNLSDLIPNTDTSQSPKTQDIIVTLTPQDQTIYQQNLYSLQNITLNFYINSNVNTSSLSEDNYTQNIPNNETSTLKIPETFITDFTNSLSYNVALNSDTNNIHYIDISDFITPTINIDDNILELGLDIKPLSTIDVGQYILKISSPYLDLDGKSSFDETSSTVDMHSLYLHFTKSPTADYIRVSNDILQNKKWITVYLSDKNYSALIPISKAIDNNNNEIRQILNMLHKPPLNDDHTALISTTPSIPYAWFNSSTGILQLNMSENNNQNYTTTDTSTKFMIEALCKTMSQIKGVKKIEFTVNKNRPKDYHGVDLSNDYIIEHPIYAYKGLVLDNKMYITPTTIKNIPNNTLDTIDLDTTLKYIINELKVSNEIFYAPLPYDVQIIEHKLTDNSLYIKFSNSLITTYPNNPTYQALMMDSIVQSIYSIDGVDKLSINIDNTSTNSSNLTEFGQVPIGTEFIPSTAINPE